MKKNIIILLIGALFIGLGVLFFVLVNTSQLSNVKKITFDELKEKLNNKESFILVFTQDTCSHCKAYIPVANKVGQQYNVTFYDISITKLNENEKNYLKDIVYASDTPTTVFIENGEEKSTLNRLVGNVQEYKIIDKLKTMGYINE